MKIFKYLEVFYWVEIIQQNVNVTDIAAKIQLSS